MKKVIVELLVDEERLTSVNGYEDMDLHDALNSELEVMRENGVQTLDWHVVKTETKLTDLIFAKPIYGNKKHYSPATEAWIEHMNDKEEMRNKDLTKYDNVNHPSHYQTKDGIETIDVIRAYTKGLDGIEAFDAGNAIKYLCRWKNKNGVEDLKKANWYLNNLIKYEEELNGN